MRLVVVGRSVGHRLPRAARRRHRVDRRHACVRGVHGDEADPSLIGREALLEALHRAGHDGRVQDLEARRGDGQRGGPAGDWNPDDRDGRPHRNGSGADEAQMVQASTGERSFAITTESVENLPISNRSFVQLATLAPGVAGSGNKRSSTPAGSSRTRSSTGRFRASTIRSNTSRSSGPTRLPATTRSIRRRSSKRRTVTRRTSCPPVNRH